MNKVKVLIVDDSVVFRSQIRTALEEYPWIEVVGVASNGRLALEKLKQSPIDLMTLDLEMPEMNGIETLTELNKLNSSTKVIVFSSTSVRGADTTLNALNMRASDFVAKPQNFEAEMNSLDKSTERKTPKQVLQNLLIPKIENLFMQNQIVEKQLTKISSIEKKPYNWKNFIPKAIVLGCSTGGPSALEKIFLDFKGPIPCPIFIVQHMPPVFTASLADRIQRISGIPTTEAKHNEIIESNHIYVAPGNYHMELIESLGVRKIILNQNEQENSVRPAVDPLFRTAVNLYKSNCMGIILTGMGKDGYLGVKALRKAGNPVLIQNKESCVVFGMPGALFDDGEYDDIDNLEGIRQKIKTVFSRL